VKFQEDSNWIGSLADLEVQDDPVSHQFAKAVLITPSSSHDDVPIARVDDVPIARVAPVTSSSSYKYAKGATVIVRGLGSSVPYNGKPAQVVDMMNDRYIVKINLSDEAETIVKVKEENLMLPEPTYEVGTLVMHRNIQKRRELNGLVARVLGFDSTSGRYLLSVNNSSPMRVIGEIEDLE